MAASRKGLLSLALPWKEIGSSIDAVTGQWPGDPRQRRERLQGALRKFVGDGHAPRHLTPLRLQLRAIALLRRTGPPASLLLLDGLELPTLGTRAWRRRVVAVPQLHANHLFAGSLAWNLLLGRAWPPSAGDLDTAAAVCRELGLGPLLDRLPAGLEQPIGEASWQLSDGEASRVCVARALLQQPELLILDESLAALDPESRVQVLAAACRRATTLLLISHLELAAGEPGLGRGGPARRCGSLTQAT